MRPTARFLSGCLGSLAWLSTQAVCAALTRSAMNRFAGHRHARKERDMHLDMDTPPWTMARTCIGTGGSRGPEPARRPAHRPARTRAGAQIPFIFST